MRISLTFLLIKSTSGPASIIIKDPDGNLILVDQHR